MSYLDCSISVIHQAYVEGKTTPLDLVKEAFSRIKANTDNCFEALDEEGALAFASCLKEVEKENFLWGIPYLAKDNISTKGIETTASSNILNGYIPPFDATIIAKLKEKKAILLGKTTLDELAMGGSGTTGHKGITYNPFDPTHQRMVGGSSCGSASSVAASIVPFALGSDTGDSVRKPASFAGLVGLKPTWGRVSRYGLFPFAPSLDHVGFFTRHVIDAAILLKELAGRDDNDATSSFKEVPDYLSFLSLGIKGKRIAFIKEIFDSLSDEFLKAKLLQMRQKLEEAGASIEDVHMDKRLLEAVYVTYFVISCAEATSTNANLDGIKFGPYYEGKTYQEVMFKARTAGFSELIKRRFVIGSFVLMKENQQELFLKAQRCRAKIVDELNKILSHYDFIFTPAAPSIASKFEEEKGGFPSSGVADNHMALGNFAGLPSISVPIGLEEGMPLGANLMGRAFEEDALLGFAATFERLSGLGGLSAINKENYR